MELHAVARPAHAETLVGDEAIAREAHGAFGQGERVLVPLEDREIALDDRHDRVLLAFLRDTHAVPAEFRRLAQQVLRPPGAGEKLAAEADAEDRLVGLAHLAHQPREFRQVGVGMVVARALFAAQNDERVVIAAVGQRLSRPGAEGLDFGIRLAQRGANLAEERNLRVINDCDAHEPALLPMRQD